MANNYTPSYNQYRTQTAGYALPSSVRTYSVFDPASNSWRRMTNDGRSPMPASPAQQQADIAGALAQARQTQGTVYPAQGMGQGQPVEVHPGYMNPPVQASAQTPSGGSVRPSPASGGGAAVVPMGQGQNVSPRVSQGQIPVLPEEGTVQAPSTLYQGMGKTQEGGTVYAPLAAAVDSRPDTRDMVTVTREGITVPAVPFGTAADSVAACVGLPSTNNKVNVADAAFRGLPEGFIKQKPKTGTPSFYWDPSERGEMNYNEEMKNLGRAISEDPETASRVGEVWGSAALAAAPVGAMVGALGKGAVWGARALAGTKLGKNLANSYRVVRNNAIERGRQVANYLGDRFYNPQNVGQKGFEKFNFNNFVDSRVPPSVQAQRLANYQQYLQNTARVETPLPPNAIRPLKSFENFRTAGF